LIDSHSPLSGRLLRSFKVQTPTTYGEFVATHPSTFVEVREPLEADHWLHMIEPKFRLLRCTEH
jgi:hypothetical protein